MSSSYRQTVVSSKSVEMSPYQRCDFAAQEELVEIVPSFKIDPIDCICGTYGPFAAYRPVQVPLWLALYLRGTNSCQINPPRQLTVPALEELLKLELDSDANFQPVRDHFFSVARMLLRFAEDDVPDAPNVHRLIEEIEQTRKAKIINNIGFLDGNDFPPKALYFSSFTAPELELLRSTLLPAINDGAELYDEAVRVPAQRGRTLGAVAPRDDGTDTATTVSDVRTSTGTSASVHGRGRLDTVASTYNFTDESPQSQDTRETNTTHTQPLSDLGQLDFSQTTHATTSDAPPPTVAPEPKRRRTLRHR